MDKPIYRFDPVSRIHWLEFDGKPDEETRTLLHDAGWRFAGYRKQWYTNRRFAKPPVEYEDGGECDYASERPDRLKHAAARAEDRAEDAYERSNALVDDIPQGQPIIVGGRHQRHHEKTLERSKTAMNQSVEEGKKSKHLSYKARSSARHQAYKERPDVIARRMKRLKADITSIRNGMKHEPYGLWSARQRQDEAKIAEIMAAWEADNQRQEEKIKLIEAEIAENEQALQEAGGLIADREAIEVGDVIKGGWRGLCEVKKINMRKGEVLSYTCTSLTKTWMSKAIIPKDEVYGVALRKGEVTSESLLVAKFEAESVHTYQPPSEPETREFKVQSVETVEIRYSNPTSIFLTPVAIADRMAQEIPHNAYLILEPSAGTGALANAVTRLLMERGQNHGVHCCEILPQLRRSLEGQGYQVIGKDFLDYAPDFLYDAIVANPPFKNAEWLKHFLHMLELLKPGGTLCGIAAIGFTYREDLGINTFRAYVEEHGWWEELPRETFAESGYDGPTVLFLLRKPKGTEPMQEESKPEEAEPLMSVTDGEAAKTEEIQESVSADVPAEAESVQDEDAGQAEVPVPDESTLRAANIPYVPPKGMEEAWALTQAIKEAEEVKLPKERPVFGDYNWIQQAKRKRRY